MRSEHHTPGVLLQTQKCIRMDAQTAAMWQDSLNNLGNAAAIVAQGKTNKKTREWNEKMYGLQRENALADWKMQNEYNHPSAQMARLREAGLNPNLVYGKGADNTASAVRSSSSGNWSPEVAPHRDMSFFSHMDVQMKQAQIDNLRVQNTVATQEALLKAATTANVAQSTEKGKFDLGLAQELRTTSLEAAKENLRKLTTGIDIDLQANERAAAMNSANLSQAAENILKMRQERSTSETQRRSIEQQIENLKKEGTLKQLDIELKNKGIQPSDNIFMRILGRLLGGDSLQDIKKAWDEDRKKPGNFKEGNWENGYLK